jgi:single-stranded-DNA-specific exonuclease
VLVEGSADWHLGVVGIVASRLVKEFHRPAVVLGGDGGLWRGSARSIEGFDLAAALNECRDLLEGGGGHAMAAGLSLRPENVEPLRSRLRALAQRWLQPEQLTPILRLDGELPLHLVNFELLEELARLEPTGQGNPAPCFLFRRVRLTRPARRMGREGRHVRFEVGQGDRAVGVVWWGADGAALPQGAIDLVARPQWNEFNGERSVELRLLDWRPSQAASPAR